MPRAKLLRFVNKDGLTIWLPATEGLWEWRQLDVGASSMGPVLQGANLFLVRGLGPREDDALCLPVAQREDGTLEADTSQGAAGQVKSCRELPAGYWTFIRPLQAGDPEIPGA